MDSNERQYILECMELCNKATSMGISILMVRRQDCNGGTDCVFTNAAPALVEALQKTISDIEEE